MAIRFRHAMMTPITMTVMTVGHLFFFQPFSKKLSPLRENGFSIKISTLFKLPAAIPPFADGKTMLCPHLFKTTPLFLNECKRMT